MDHTEKAEREVSPQERFRRRLSRELAGLADLTAGRAVLSLVLLTGLVYANALGGGFILDDETIYVDDPGMARQTLASAFSSHPPEFLRHPAGYYYFRPGAVLAHSWLLRLFGLEPFALHFASSAVHAAASVLVLLLVLEFAEIRVAWLAAALFVVHPLHVEAVAWMAGLPEVLAGTLVLLSLYALLRARHAPKWWLAVSYLAGAAAMLTKETALGLPLLAAIFGVWSAWPFFALAGGAVLLRLSVLGNASPSLPARTLWQHLHVAAAAALHYLKKLAIPWPLALDYELSHSALAWLIFAAVCGLGAWLAWRNRQARLAVLATVAALLPALAGSLVLPALSRAQDRYAYVAVFGFALLIGLASRYRPAAWAGLALVALWAVLAVRDMAHWRDSEALWTHTLRATPTSKNAVLGLGGWYFSTLRFEEAVRVYEKGLAVRPNDREIQYSLASARKALKARNSR